MIQPKPFKVKCQSCGWSQVIAPKSDVLMPNEIAPERCPKCGGHVATVPLNPLEEIFSRMFG